jgi:DNA replication protein DnaC
VSERPMTPAERMEAIHKLRASHGLDVTSHEEVMLSRRIPRRFWALVKEPKETMAMSYARALLEGKGVLLLLHGNAGCGKSTAAAWALSQRHGGLWVNAPDLARPATEEDDATDRELATVPFLVIDDLGIEYSTDKKYAESRINLALSKREANVLPTIITTNLSTEEFKARYGDRTASRLNGDPLGWQSVKGPDMRRERHNPAPFNERGEK